MFWDCCFLTPGAAGTRVVRGQSIVRGVILSSCFPQSCIRSLKSIYSSGMYLRTRGFFLFHRVCMLSQTSNAPARGLNSYYFADRFPFAGWRSYEDMPTR